jgi:hypothetical protein
MFCSPDRRRAELHANWLAEPPVTEWEWFEHGEPPVFYRVEHRVGRGWCVYRYPRHEVSDA